MMMDEVDRILRQAQGQGEAWTILQRTMLEFPAMVAAVVIVQTADGAIVARAGGCSLVETLGLLNFAAIATVQSHGQIIIGGGGNPNVDGSN